MKSRFRSVLERLHEIRAARACTGFGKKNFPSLRKGRPDKNPYAKWDRLTYKLQSDLGLSCNYRAPFRTVRIRYFYRISHSLVDAARKLCPQFVIYALRTREWVGLHSIISGKTDYFKIFTTSNVYWTVNNCDSWRIKELEWYPCCRLQPATRIPLQPNHTETPTHIEPRTIRPMW